MEDELSRARDELRRKPNADILDHERKRAIEVKLVVYREELEDEGVADDEIERRVAERRRELQAAGPELPDPRTYAAPLFLLTSRRSFNAAPHLQSSIASDASVGRCQAEGSRPLCQRTGHQAARGKARGGSAGARRHH